MKNAFFKIVVSTFIWALFFLMSSCQKETPSPVTTNPEIKGDSTSIYDTAGDRTLTYTCTSPVLGQWTPCSAPSQNTSCGNFIGNKIKARAVQIQNGKLYVEVRTCDGTTLNSAGTLYIKVDGACGPLHKYWNFGYGLSQWSTNFYLFHQSGVKCFYAIIVLENGQKYISEPIAIEAAGGSGHPLDFGATFMGFNGVNIYTQGVGTSGYVSNEYSYVNNVCMGMKWSYDEFVNRYYFQYYNKYIVSPMVPPGQYFATAAQRGLIAIPKGSSQYPQVGNIVCYTGGSSGLVGLVTSSNSTGGTVRIQNYEPNNVTFTQFWNPSSSPTYKSPLGADYTLIGWLKKP